jgi:hypothetical protein
MIKCIRMHAKLERVRFMEVLQKKRLKQRLKRQNVNGVQKSSEEMNGIQCVFRK